MAFDKPFLDLDKQLNLLESRNLIMGYRTKRVGFIGDGASKLLAPSLF